MNLFNNQSLRIFFVLFLLIVLCRCGENLSANETLTVNENTLSEETQSNSCQQADLEKLENEITNRLNNVVTDRSFYFEIKRPLLDQRKFKYKRNIDEDLGEDSTIKSASTAKLISAAVILDVISNPQNYPGGGIVNGKKLSLDSFAKDFLFAQDGRSYWVTDLGYIPKNNRLNTVTLRHLLSFTSGLDLEKKGTSLSCIAQSENIITHGNCVTQLVTINLAKNMDLNGGRTFFYNGAHMSVASLMAVQAAGVKNWATLFKIFKEKHGVFLGDVSPQLNTTEFGLGAYYPFSDAHSSPSPGGALRYRAGDYTAFLEKLYLKKILNQTLLAEMFSNQISQLNVDIEYTPVKDWQEDWQYGLGLWNECQQPVWNLSCRNTRFSSPGSFGSYPFIDLNHINEKENPLIGFIAQSGTEMGTAYSAIQIYRSLGDGMDGVKDLAQKWAANLCD